MQTKLLDGSRGELDTMAKHNWKQTDSTDNLIVFRITERDTSLNINSQFERCDIS